MNTNIKYGKKARLALKEGVDMVANAVKISLGAEGRNVIFPLQVGNNYSYIISKDGVSIAKSVNPKGEYEKIGAGMIKEAANRANSMAGDGTTTATVIAQGIFEMGLQLMEEDSNISSTEFKKGIDEATKEVVKHLEKVSKKVSTSNLEDVATISANGDNEIGKIIASAFNKIGKNGTVISAVSDTPETYVDLKDGVVLDRGYYHPNFISNNIKGVCELNNPLVLLHRGKIETGDAISELFNIVFSEAKNTLLIITDDIDPFILSTINENIAKGPLKDKICVVKTPQILKIEKDLMSDVSVLTGAKVVSEEMGVKISPEVLGRLNKVIVSEKDSLLIGNNNNLKSLVKELKQRITSTKNKFDKLELQERLSRITGGVATLYVGAKSDSELKEKQDRIEDSINATRSALEEGIVPGGGIALENTAKELLKSFSYEDEDIISSFDLGYLTLLESCCSPVKQICSNAGMEYESQPVEGEGLNVKTGKVVNMLEAGIIDPKKVTRCAIENAASVAGTFLTTSVVIAVDN